MNKEQQLIDKYGRKSPFKVPDGYFESLPGRITASLPDYPEAERPGDLSLWKRVRPYLYLAAMFAGIWWMMKVFHSVSQTPDTSLDNPPLAVVTALDDADTYAFIVDDPDDVSYYEIVEDLSARYTDINDLSADLGIEIKPEYNVNLTSL